ncbi:MAG: PKD domain-containing protein, partial [Candidatus Promineifilaceae bacterium]|nr:PKD domain-containing protein [Candidatus Promineifilaceae bacterium]
MATVLLLNLSLGIDPVSGQKESSFIDLVTRLEIDRFDLGHPAALAADSRAGTLLLLTRDKKLHTISTFGDLRSSAKVPNSADLIAYDGHSGRMLVFDAERSLLISLPWPQNEPAAAGPLMELPSAVSLSAAGVTGMTVDPSTGDIYLLSRNSRRLERFGSSGLDRQSPQLVPQENRSLAGLSANLAGLAFDPASRHLFSLTADASQLLELTTDGRQVRTYDLTPFNLPSSLTLAFAPSTDQTDAPSATSLFLAGGGADGDVWEFTLAQPKAVPAAAVAATLVQTIEVWQFNPPSPDASGATYLPSSNTLLETDSEVNEKEIYDNVNQFEMSLSGTLQNTYDTTHFSGEPTGIAYDSSRNHLFLTDDNAKKINEVDLNYNLINSFGAGTIDGKSVDPEGIAYDSANDRLFIAGGVSDTIFWIDPGPDNNFGTSDDIEGSFDATGLSDPEGITYNTDNGNVYAVGKGDEVAEYTTAGVLVQLIDITAANARKPAGLAYGPTSTGGGKSIYVTDRGVDSDSHINGGDGDGRIYEFALGSVGPPPPPVAAFSGSPTVGPAALTVDFNNNSSGIYGTCSWDFGDTGTSTDCNDPSHTYTSTGTYSVSLTVTGAGGSDTKTETNYITVVEPAVADFDGAPTEIAAPDAVTFNNNSGGAYDTCSWDFGDGAGSSSCNAAVNHTYTVGGVYSVKLTVSGDGGSDMLTRTDYITVHQAPAVALSASDTEGPAPLTVDFTNETTGDYDTCTWDFDLDDPGTSTSSSCAAVVLHIYNSAGTYSVKLTVGGSWGSDALTKTSYINVHQPAAAAFSVNSSGGIAPHE